MFIFTTLLLASLNFTMLDRLERPELTIAQGILESNLNTKAIGRAGEKGAWQVREKYWGKVPKSFKGQADQAEDILKELLEANNGNLRVALRKYNGSGTKAHRYANQVCKRTLERCLMFV